MFRSTHFASGFDAPLGLAIGWEPDPGAMLEELEEDDDAPGLGTMLADPETAAGELVDAVGSALEAACGGTAAEEDPEAGALAEGAGFFAAFFLMNELSFGNPMVSQLRD